MLVGEKQLGKRTRSPWKFTSSTPVATHSTMACWWAPQLLCWVPRCKAWR